MATPQGDSPKLPESTEESNPVVADGHEGEEGEDSDDYGEDFEGEEDEDEDDDEEDVQPSRSQSGLTALLLANPNPAVQEEEEEDDEDDDDDEYVEEPSTEAPAASASKKRGIEEVAPEDEAETNGDAKKVKA